MIKYIKYIYIFKFKKKILKLVWIIVAKLYLQNNSKNVIEIIKKNRKHLAKQVDLISLDEYSKNNYGIPKKNYHLINKPINSNLINIDLIVYILKNMNLTKINYLEIGASVLKTFMTINNSVSNINQTAYDINPLMKKYDKNFEDNSLIYFQGDVLNSVDTSEFNKINTYMFDFVFSDALHAKTAVEKEFESIIKNNLNDNFIIYYDDLKLGGKNNTVEEAVKIIYKKLNSENNNTSLYTFWIYGWLGQYEDMHKNAIITNIDIESILEKENIRLPFFKKIKNHN